MIDGRSNMIDPSMIHPAKQPPLSGKAVGVGRRRGWGTPLRPYGEKGRYPALTLATKFCKPITGYLIRGKYMKLSGHALAAAAVRQLLA